MSRLGLGRRRCCSARYVHTTHEGPAPDDRWPRSSRSRARSASRIGLEGAAPTGWGSFGAGSGTEAQPTAAEAQGRWCWPWRGPFAVRHGELPGADSGAQEPNGRGRLGGAAYGRRMAKPGGTGPVGPFPSSVSDDDEATGRVRPAAPARAVDDAVRAVRGRLDRRRRAPQRDDPELGDAGELRAQARSPSASRRRPSPTSSSRRGRRVQPVHDRPRGPGHRAEVHQAGRGRPRRPHPQRLPLPSTARPARPILTQSAAYLDCGSTRRSTAVATRSSSARSSTPAS